MSTNPDDFDGIQWPITNPNKDTTTEPPTWDDMPDLDKGCALLHLHKREQKGPRYAVEHYPARYLEDPRLTDLDHETASAHAVSLSYHVNALDTNERHRLYNLALDAAQIDQWDEGTTDD